VAREENREKSNQIRVYFTLAASIIVFTGKRGIFQTGKDRLRLCLPENKVLRLPD
jgi:hypothetical protein